MNAVHGSDSLESAQRELNFWFPASASAAKPAVIKATTGGRSLSIAPPASISADTWPEMTAYMNHSIDPILAPIILRVSYTDIHTLTHVLLTTY